MKKIFAFFLMGLLIAPVMAFSQESIVPKADSTMAGQIGAAGKMSTQPIDQTLNTVANYAIGVLIIVAVFYIIWAGYTFVAHGTDPDSVAKARQRIMFAGVGVIVALLAKGIVSLVLSAMQGS